MSSTSRNDRDGGSDERAHEAADPSARERNEDFTDGVQDDQRGVGGNDEQRAGLQNRQAAQNHDLNDRYDPSNGKTRDQLRRNDKRGRMGG